MENNNRWTIPLVKEELHSALFYMHPNKSPGPDNFNPTFYPKFLDLYCNDIWKAVTAWLERDSFSLSQNDTNISLIPKCANPDNMKDFHPIYLCNVVYKLVYKALANILKIILDKCVTEEQSTFVGVRYILDNAMIAIKIIHALKHKTKGSKAHLALKVDIIKAYNIVDSFFRGMLSRMGFMDQLIHRVMMCITSMHYTILVNLDRMGPIKPGRGLRQGNPLSSYLFIIVSEGISTLIKGAMASGDIHGILSYPKICPLVIQDIFQGTLIHFSKH